MSGVRSLANGRCNKRPVDGQRGTTTPLSQPMLAIPKSRLCTNGDNLGCLPDVRQGIGCGPTVSLVTPLA
jgi:hypothetical protein